MIEPTVQETPDGTDPRAVIDFPGGQRVTITLSYEGDWLSMYEDMPAKPDGEMDEQLARSTFAMTLFREVAELFNW